MSEKDKIFREACEKHWSMYGRGDEEKIIDLYAGTFGTYPEIASPDPE